MKIKNIGKTPLTGFTVFVFLVCLLNLLLNTINGRFWLSDFKVYYSAAENLLSGGVVYQQAYGLGSGFYKYSPVILLFFVPYTVFSYTVASVVHFTILSFAFWYALILVRRILELFFPGQKMKRENLLLSLTLVFILLHLVRELYLGNINILLVMLSLMALKDFLERKPMRGGILLGIVILTKPFFLLLIIPLVLRKMWRELGWLGITATTGLLIPFLVTGPSKAISLYSGWISTIISHDESFPGMNSADYLTRYYLMPGLPNTAGYLFILIAGLLLSLFVILNMNRENQGGFKREMGRMDLSYEWFLILALIPNLVKTDSEHFLATAPTLAFMLYYIAWSGRRWLIPVMAVLFFFFGANSYDLLGKELSQKLFEMGFLGMSNLMILILSLFVFLKFRESRFNQDRPGISS